MSEGVYGETNRDKGEKNKENEQHREGEERQRREEQGSGGKTTKREKRRQKICNENEGRWLIEKGGRYKEKRARKRKWEEKGREV